MSDDVTIVVRVNDQTAAGFRDVNGRLRDMNGRFATSAGDMRRSSSVITKALVDVKASLLSLAPAAIPVAASFAPIAVQAGAAGLAVGAFGAAVAPQIGQMGEAAKAQDKYSEAVRKYGAQSQKAAAAQLAAAQVLSDMPAATQRASAAYSNLRQEFKDFSDSTAKFTMVPVEHSFAVLGAIIPKLTPMVQGTSTQLDRLMKVAGGGINTSGFDALSKRVSNFANQSLKNATDGAIHFIRVMSEGNATGPMAQFMDYAREQGPAVKELFHNLAAAVGNLAQGAAEAGPGLLTVVNALARMVAAVPPELAGHLMQVYAAFKLITLAGAGIAGIGGGISSLVAKIAALRAASTAAGGGVAGLRAAFASLSVAAKGSIVVGGLAVIALGIDALAKKARGAPPDVDRLVTSLKSLATTGKFVGELKDTFGSMDGFSKAMGRLRSESSALEKVKPLTGFSGIGSFFDTAVSKVDDLVNGSKGLNATKDDLKSLDEAFASMAKNGYADQAASQFKGFEKALKAQGYSTKEINGLFTKYKSAVADLKAEQTLAAQSQGLFGAQAQKTQTALEAQKASADGLRQSIQALNDAQRAGLGGMIGFEAAIDAAAKAAQDNAGALSMNHGVLDLNSEKARNAASALQDLADKTDSAAASARESGSSWETVNGIYSRGRDKLIESAQAMGLTKEQAAQLASQILQIPDKATTEVDMRTEDAISGLDSVLAALNKTPNAKSVTVSALTADAVTMLRSLGLTVKQLPDGRFTVSAATGAAKSAIAAVQAARDALKNKSFTLTAQDKASATARSIAAAIAAIRSKTVTLTTVQHTLGIEGMAGRNAKNLNGMAEGGPISGGSGTRDDIPLLAMGGEFIINKKQTAKYRSLIEAINEDRVPKFAKGGLTKGQLTGLSRPSDVSSLTSTLAEVRTSIKSRTSGSVESRLLHTLDAVGKKLIANEKSLTSVNKALDGAKTKLNDLRQTASQLSGSVRSGVLSAASITGGTNGDKPTTLASIMTGLTASRDKATAFSGALKGLQSKGVRSDLIQQIAEAGINGGGLDTAGVLLGASSSEIGSLNSLQSQIASAAKSAGQTTSTAVYGAAIKAQTEAAAKLQRSQDRLEKTMSDLAKSLNRSIVKAGGKAAGGIVGAAASGGVRGGLTWVGEHEPELLQLPAGSRVWSGPDSRRKAAAGGGGGDVRVVLELRASSSSRYEEFLLSELRSAINSRGGNAQLVLTGRKQP